MSGPSEGLLVAEDAALRGSAALLTAMGGTMRLYQGAPPAAAPGGAPLPYVVIGEHLVLGDDEECGEAEEIQSTVRCWASTPVQARQMARAVRTAFANPISIDGRHVVAQRFESERLSSDPDRSTQAASTFVYLTTESGA